MMDEDRWYSSDEHLRTEMSYSDYVKTMKAKKKKKKRRKSVTSPFGMKIKMPNFKL